MHLTPKELDRLTIFTVAEMARRRKSKGIKLNHPEAMGLITDEVMEQARAGMPYEQISRYAKTLLTKDDVLDGVPELLNEVLIEAGFKDGTKLIVIDNPIE
ncbi:MAG TPA: urease subunit gamma [Anaerovoracaceae bacterium]|nr:urease subunit gamma [Anaerovoracaceae bacterium]